MEKTSKKIFTPQNTGFTLIETLLYISIITIMISSLIPFAWNIIGSSTKSSTAQEVSSAARYVSEKIKYEIRNASGIDAANSNFGLNLSSNPSYKITLLNPSGSTVFTVQNGKVLIASGGPGAALNSTDTRVDDLTFTNYSSSDGKTKHIGFTMTISLINPSQRSEFKNTISLRTSSEVRSN